MQTAKYEKYFIQVQYFYIMQCWSRYAAAAGLNDILLMESYHTKPVQNPTWNLVAWKYWDSRDNQLSAAQKL